MKALYLIGGTMGVGKTAVSRELAKLLPDSVFLDGDWCWDIHPFRVTEATKKLVMDNICAMLGNFLKCPEIENTVFCWVMHEQSVLNEILSRLEPVDCRVIAISLTCSEEALRMRLQKDIDEGLRTADILQRSISRLPLYGSLNTEKLDTTFLSPRQAAERIAGKYS